MVDLDLAYATTLLAAVLLGVGFVLQQYSAEQEPDSRFLHLRILTDLLRKPRWLLGVACMVAGYLLAAWSISHLELTLVEPLLTTYLVWALVLAVPLSRQSLKPATMQAMPRSQRGLRSRSVRMRRRRNRDSGSCSAEYCCRTNPMPSNTAAKRVVA